MTEEQTIKEIDEILEDIEIKIQALEEKRTYYQSLKKLIKQAFED